MSDQKKPAKVKSKRPTGNGDSVKIAKKKKSGSSEQAKPSSIANPQLATKEKARPPAVPSTSTSVSAKKKKAPSKKETLMKPDEQEEEAPVPKEEDKPVKIVGDSSIGIADDGAVDATFESLGLCPQLVQACTAVGWKKPTEIQRETLPHAFAGKDLIGLAETGSGKTGAFGLPMLQALLKNPQPLFGLILAPTRELAFQITQQLEALGAGIGVRCVSIVGGVDMMDQAIALAKKPHIIVASPGRIVDHLENTKGFHLRNLKFLVMDEADRLLNLDFEKALDKLLAAISRERTTYLFSATMTSKVGKLQRASLSNPVKVEVSKKYQTVKGLVQQYVFIPAKYKDCYLAYILNELAGNTAIIFAGKREQAQRLALMLRNLGFSAIPLHGKMSQSQRLGSLNKFKAGERGILIATDVASRGLDIPAVDLVINYDIPSHSKDYVHRVGRTARAGRSGRAISIVTQYEVELFQRIEVLIEKKMELYTTENDAVMVLLERVGEAQRIAALEMREADEAGHGVHGNKGKPGKGKRGGKRSSGGRGEGGGGGGGGGYDEEAD